MLVQQNTIAPAALTLDGGGATTGIGFFMVPLAIPSEYRIDVAAADGELFTETETVMGVGAAISGIRLASGDRFRNRLACKLWRRRREFWSRSCVSGCPRS